MATPAPPAPAPAPAPASASVPAPASSAAEGDNEAVWYYTVDASGRTAGPLSATAVAAAVPGGSTFVWREGMEKWLPASDVPQVATHLTSKAADTTNKAPAAASTTSVDSQFFWYYVDAATKQTTGPVHLTQLQALFEAGDVDGVTTVWQEGMKEWKSIAELPDLRQTLQVMATALNVRASASGVHGV